MDIDKSIRTIALPAGRLIGALLLSAILHASVGAAEEPVTEAAPTVHAEAVLGAAASGPNYTVADEVRSDGLLRLFVLETNFGSFEIAGEDLMRVRIRELAAL